MAGKLKGKVAIVTGSGQGIVRQLQSLSQPRSQSGDQ